MTINDLTREWRPDLTDFRQPGLFGSKDGDVVVHGVDFALAGDDCSTVVGAELLPHLVDPPVELLDHSRHSGVVR